MKPKRYFRILVAGFVLWVVETAYFGFNASPENSVEALLDMIAAGMIIYGLIGDLVTNVEIHKNYYKYKETNIKTRSVEVKGDNPVVNNVYNSPPATLAPKAMPNEMYHKRLHNYLFRRHNDGN